MNKAIKRVVKDIKEINKNPIENVYYEPDEDNVMRGYVMICGVKDTPYCYGNYFFTFNFTDKYPFEPPKVKFETGDGVVRMNPNLYRNGKVCLSILNTWSGEKWSSCQSISTICLNLQLVLNENPYLNEPGINKVTHHYDIQHYNDIIHYKNIKLTIYNYLSIENIPKNFKQFYEIIVERFMKNYENIVNEFKNKKCILRHNSLYSMNSMSLNYPKLLLMINDKYNEIKKIEK